MYTRTALLLSLLALSACSITTRTPSVKAAQQAPDFTLPDQAGDNVALSDLTGSDGYTLLVFYRGHW